MIVQLVNNLPSKYKKWNKGIFKYLGKRVIIQQIQDTTDYTIDGAEYLGNAYDIRSIDGVPTGIWITDDLIKKDKNTIKLYKRILKID